MTNSKKMTRIQWVSILFSGTLFSVISYSKFTAGNTDILLYAASQVVAGVIVYMISVPLKKYFGRCHEGIILHSKSVKPNASFWYSVIYALYFMYVSSGIIIIGTLFIKNYVDNYLITALFISVIVICTYFSAVRGIQGIAGSTVLLVMLSGAAVLFVFISLSFRADMLNFSYVYSVKYSDVWKTVGYSISGASLLPCMIVFRKITDDKSLKGINTWVVLSVAAGILIALMTYAVSGEYSNYTQFPFYTSAQLLEVGAFKRLDVLFLLIWVIGIYVNVSVMFSSLKEVLYMTAEAVKAKHLFRISVLIIAVFSGMAVSYERLRNIFLSFRGLTAFIVLTVFVLPIAVNISFKYLKKRRPAKVMTLLMLSAVCMAVLTGCGKTEIQDRLIIKGVGVDKNTIGYDVTVQYIDTSSQGETQTNKCFTVSGKTIADAMGKIKNSIGLEPFLGQLSAVVAGYETAENMDNISDYFMRRSDIRPSVKLYLSESTAKEILGFEKDGTIMPIDKLTSISPELSVKSNEYTLLSYKNQRLDPTQTPVATVLRCEDTIRLSTMAVFGSNGIYTLDDNNLTAYKTMKGINKGTVLCKDEISCIAETCKEKVTLDNSDKLSIYSSSEFYLTVLENPKKYSEKEICRIYEDYLEEIINRSAEEILEKKHDDIYGFGRRLIKFDRKKGGAEEQYRELLSECKLNINIKCKIVNKSE